MTAYLGRLATYDGDHKAILDIAKTSKYTSAYGNYMFSGKAAYEKGWIQVVTTKDDKVVGYFCCRVKVREPVTELYFFGVHPEFQREGIALFVLTMLIGFSKHRDIGLNVMKENKPAVSFYLKHGFKIVRDAFGGQAHRMHLRW